MRARARARARDTHMTHTHTLTCLTCSLPGAAAAGASSCLLACLPALGGRRAGGQEEGSGHTGRGVAGPGEFRAPTTTTTEHTHYNFSVRGPIRPILEPTDAAEGALTFPKQSCMRARGRSACAGAGAGMGHTHAHTHTHDTPVSPHNFPTRGPIRPILAPTDAA